MRLSEADRLIYGGRVLIPGRARSVRPLKRLVPRRAQAKIESRSKLSAPSLEHPDRDPSLVYSTEEMELVVPGTGIEPVRLFRDSGF